MDTVLIQRGDGRMTVTLNRPDALNALNNEVLLGLQNAISSAEQDEDVRVIVVRGAGDRAFCAGADLDELAGLDAAAALSHIRAGHAVLRLLERSHVPSVAAVHGFALGGGFELALSCSMVIAAEGAQFALPEVGLGLIPGFGGTQRLPAAIGRSAALHVMLTGRRLSAGDAHRLGLLVEPPVPQRDFDEQIDALVDRVVGASQTAVAAILAAATGRVPLDVDLDREAALAAIAIVSPDGRDGIAAFRARPRAADTRAGGVA